MPYVTDDESKAARKITEIEQRLQEAKAKFERWLTEGCTPRGAAELAQREREGKALTDRLQALATALELQRALASVSESRWPSDRAGRGRIRAEPRLSAGWSSFVL